MSLIERLRTADEFLRETRVTPNGLYSEAATQLEAMQAEIERLRENITELWHSSEAGREDLQHYLGMSWEEYCEWVTPRASLGQEEG